jgi:hypothetical protein
MKERISVAEDKRIEEAIRQRKASEWLSKSVSKTNARRFIEEEAEEERFRAVKIKDAQEMQKK